MSSAAAVAAARNPTIDLTALLAPIAGENPAGVSLQYAGLYDEIREARRGDEELAQGEWKTEIKSSEWPKVIELAVPALTTRTKDLQVCVWLGEALVKVHGFDGLLDALKLTRGLLANFWESLYPELEDGDLEGRANALAWFDRQLALAIKGVPVTAGLTGGHYNFFQAEEAKEFDYPETFDNLSSEEIAKFQDLKDRAEREGRVNARQWKIAVNTTPRQFLEEAAQLLGDCQAEFSALDAVMDEKFQRETPGLGALKKSLGEVRDLVGRLLKEKRAQEPDPAPVSNEVKPLEEQFAEAAAAAVGAAPAAIAFSSAAGAGAIRARQDAFKTLAEVAAFFRRTEPHSPVAYLVERAIKWGQMPLEKWLEDVVKNGDVLEQVREVLGLKMENQ